jgi:hypothetical protein
VEEESEHEDLGIDTSLEDAVVASVEIASGSVERSATRDEVTRALLPPPKAPPSRRILPSQPRPPAAKAPPKAPPKAPLTPTPPLSPPPLEAFQVKDAVDEPSEVSVEVESDNDLQPNPGDTPAGGGSFKHVVFNNKRLQALSMQVAPKSPPPKAAPRVPPTTNATAGADATDDDNGWYDASEGADATEDANGWDDANGWCDAKGWYGATDAQARRWHADVGQVTCTTAARDFTARDIQGIYKHIQRESSPPP